MYLIRHVVRTVIVNMLEVKAACVCSKYLLSISYSNEERQIVGRLRCLSQRDRFVAPLSRMKLFWLVYTNEGYFCWTPPFILLAVLTRIDVFLSTRHSSLVFQSSLLLFLLLEILQGQPSFQPIPIPILSGQLSV